MMHSSGLGPQVILSSEKSRTTNLRAAFNAIRRKRDSATALGRAEKFLDGSDGSASTGSFDIHIILMWSWLQLPSDC